MESNAHREIQEKLLNKTLLVFGIIVIPTLVGSLLLCLDMGWQPAFTTNIMAAFAIVIFAVYRKAISYKIKISFLIILYFIIAVSSSINFGLNGFLLEFLMLAVFFGVLFCGRKCALLIYLGGAFVIAMIGILNVTGTIPLVANIEIYLQRYTAWLAVLTTFIFITGLMILVAGDIGHLLSQKINELHEKNIELQLANNEIKQLQGILPICSKCKKIRDSDGYWKQVESYIEDNSDAKFSHGLCEKCANDLYGDQFWYNKNKE